MENIKCKKRKEKSKPYEKKKYLYIWYKEKFNCQVCKKYCYLNCVIFDDLHFLSNCFFGDAFDTFIEEYTACLSRLQKKDHSLYLKKEEKNPFYF